MRSYFYPFFNSSLIFNFLILQFFNSSENRFSWAKVKCDYAIEKLFPNRIFNRKTKIAGTPLFIGEKELKKKCATERPSSFNRTPQSHLTLARAFLFPFKKIEDLS
jgi:hypothetical protein